MDDQRYALERMAGHDPRSKGLSWDSNLVLIESAAQAAKDVLAALARTQAESAWQPIERLRLERDTLARALMEIKHATLAGRICDDVAWFYSITTLHDFCEITLNRVTRSPKESAHD